MRLSQLTIDDGIAGTEQTLIEMFRLVVAAQADPILMEFTDVVAGGTPAHRELRLIDKVVRGWLRAVTIREDPVRHEFLRSPLQTLARGSGDCDDLAIGVASSLEYLGFPIEFVVVSDTPLGADEFTHVYLRAWLPVAEMWLPIDPRSMAEFGWSIGQEVSPEAITARRSYGFDEEGGTLIMGAGGFGRLGQADPFQDVPGIDPLTGTVSATGGAAEAALTQQQQQLLAEAAERAERTSRLTTIFLTVSIVTGVVTIGSILFRGLR